MKELRALSILSAAFLLTWALAGCNPEAPPPSGGETGAPEDLGAAGGQSAATGEPDTAGGASAGGLPASAGTPGAPASGEEYVVVTTEHGEIVITLRDDVAPRHCENFRKLVQSGFYSGKTFHRAIEEFIVQGGDPDPAGNGTGSFGEGIQPEIKLPHRRGAVGMARKQDQANPNRVSYGSQFFICLADLPELDAAGYTIFGQVVKGFDAVLKTTMGDVDIDNGVVPPARRTKIVKAEIRRMDIEPEALDAAKPAPAGTDEYVVLETDVKQGDGKIYIDVFEASAPKHAANFKKLAREGFYNNVTFHRVIDGFMAQGGDPEGTGSGGPGYTLDAEIELAHLRGSVAAARQGDGINPQRRSSGSQFYICFAPQPSLDQGGYSVFGHVVKGMDVVDRIPKGERTRNGVLPVEQRARIVKAYLVPASEVTIDVQPPAK